MLAKSSDALRRPEQLLFSYPLLSTYPYCSGAALSSSVCCYVSFFCCCCCCCQPHSWKYYW